MLRYLKNLLRNKGRLFLLAVMTISLLLNIYLISFDSRSGSIESEDYTDASDALNSAEEVDFLVPEPVKDILKKQEKADVAKATKKPFVVTKAASFEKILAKEGVDKKEIQKITKAIRKVYDKGFAPGDEILIEDGDFEKRKDGKNSVIKKLKINTQLYKIDVSYAEKSQTFNAKSEKLPVQTKTKLVKSKINNSIYSSARNAGADSKVVMELVDLYSHTLDFQRDIRADDEFKILYEQQFNMNGKPVSKPNIIYASISSKGEDKELYQYVHASGKIDYFNPKGEGSKRALLKTPIKGAKMTSGYGVRKHPVLGYSRMHQGLDYAAPVGTPVLASGEGVIKAVKNQPSGYGRHVEIKHNNTYSTLYAHLSRFAPNLKPGMKIAQGQVIGYVGTSGMSTGPHLHYEVIQAGKKVNPNKTNFAKSNPLKGKDLKRLQQHINQVELKVAQLERENGTKVMHASAGPRTEKSTKKSVKK